MYSIQTKRNLQIIIMAETIKALVEGEFEKGATVRIVDRKGNSLAVGTSNYPSDKLRQITGLRSEDIRRVLNENDAYDEAVHRNNMVVL